MPFQTIFTLLASAFFGAFGIPQMFPEVLAWSIFERLELTLVLPLVFGIIIFLKSTYSWWIGYIERISEKLAQAIFWLIFNRYARLFYLTIIMLAIVFASNFNYSVSALSLIAFIIFLSSLKQFPLQEYKIINSKEIIFEDDFINDRGWFLNYWGTTNPNKTNRIENSTMIFEANNEEVLNQNNEYGAYIDLRNGILNGQTYEIICKLKSETDTTMGFQLWVHDTRGGNMDVSKKEPKSFYTPKNIYRELRLKYTANSTNAIRIHLHNKAGVGKIIVDKIMVLKI